MQCNFFTPFPNGSMQNRLPISIPGKPWLLNLYSVWLLYFFLTSILKDCGNLDTPIFITVTFSNIQQRILFKNHINNVSSEISGVNNLFLEHIFKWVQLSNECPTF
uniref:Uncharacterized protein n=1 Tax=Opuntia streptacantha TaxID=393608 RepID=A0A7C9E9E4_OPUST